MPTLDKLFSLWVREVQEAWGKSARTSHAITSAHSPPAEASQGARSQSGRDSVPPPGSPAEARKEGQRTILTPHNSGNGSHCNPLCLAS